MQPPRPRPSPRAGMSPRSEIQFGRDDIRVVLNLELVYLSDEDFESFFEALDADGDGRVSLLEYLRIPDILDERLGVATLYA